MDNDSVIELFCLVDNFCLEIKEKIYRKLFPTNAQRRRRPGLADSEIMTIVILFQRSGYRTFKQFYLAIQATRKSWFPKMPSYQRFVEIMPSVIFQLFMFAKSQRGKVTGINFIDSTVLRVCNIKRAKRNKVFANTAKFGKSTVGWFYGFKLHIVINEIGEILAFKVTTGSVEDRKPVEDLTKDIIGKLYADKGYISQKLFEKLYERGLQLVTGIKSNMKNKLMPLKDKIMLRKRSLIETVNDQLKNICQVEHSRHRSILNFLVNVLGSLIAYMLQPKKPSINFDIPEELMGLNTLSILI